MKIDIKLVLLFALSTMLVLIPGACSLKCYTGTELQNDETGEGHVGFFITFATALGLAQIVGGIATAGLFGVGVANLVRDGRRKREIDGAEPELVLQACLTGECGADACDTCLSIYTSMGDSYSCGSLANTTVEGIKMTQDGCTMVSDKFNHRIVGNAVKKLESQKKQSPEMADQIDQEIEQIKKSKIEKLCSCSSDGCNDPQEQ